MGFEEGISAWKGRLIVGSQRACGFSAAKKL